MSRQPATPGGAYPLVLFTSPDGAVTVPTRLERDTLWLTQEQMARVFDVKRPAITKHLANIFKTQELDKFSVSSILEHTAADGKAYATQFYNLDAIIAVGYRVNSRRATQFRIWATGVLREYLLKGFALNQVRLKELGQIVRILKRAEKQLDARQVLSVVERYTAALDLLDAYDHQRVAKPKGRRARTRLTYDECRRFIDAMGFGSESALFGREKDASFKSSIGAIYQTFDGREVYPTVEEKAANLLYLRVPSSRSLRLPLPGPAPTEHEGYRATQNYGTHYAGGVNVNPSFQDFSKGAYTAGRLSAATLSRARKSAGIRAGVGCFGT